MYYKFSPQNDEAAQQIAQRILGQSTSSADPMKSALAMSLGHLSLARSPQPAPQQQAAQTAQQFVGQPTQNVAQGIGQMVAGAGLGLSKFNQQQNAAFPQAPGGAKPSLGTGLANFFTGRNNGGLY